MRWLPRRRRKNADSGRATRAFVYDAYFTDERKTRMGRRFAYPFTFYPEQLRLEGGEVFTEQPGLVGQWVYFVEVVVPDAKSFYVPVSDTAPFIVITDSRLQLHGGWLKVLPEE